MGSGKSSEPPLNAHDQYKVKHVFLSFNHLKTFRQRFNLSILLAICVLTEIISPVHSMSVGQTEVKVLSTSFDLNNSTGVLDFSLCQDSIRTKLEDIFGPTDYYPVYSRDSPKSIRHFNYKCSWFFHHKISPQFVVQFKIKDLDLPKCPDATLTLDSDSYNSKDIPPDKWSIGEVYSIQASSLAIVYRHSTTCPVLERHGFYITYKTSPHQRLRREASDSPTNEGQNNPNSGVSQQPVKPSSGALQQQKSAQPTQNPAQPTTTVNANNNNGDSDSSDDSSWKIAVGVVIPVIFVSIILIITYRIYRKKFPVRMILGRQFRTFRNPNYNRPSTGLSLVRDDSNWENRLSTEYDPEYQNSDLKIPYDNKGFEGDEVDLGDESVEDRDFRMKKSWLFNKKEDIHEKQNASNNVVGGESSTSRLNEVDEVDSKERENVAENKEYSDDSDIEAMLQEQKVTPRLKRKNISESDLSTTSTSSGQITIGTNPAQSDYSSKTYDSDEKLDTVEIPEQIYEKKSNFVEKLELSYQQIKSVDEMRAEYKARARSMSGSKCPKVDRPRSFSLQIDPSKSARRGSGSGSGSLNDSNAAGRDLRRFVMQNVTAEVVGVAYLSASTRAMYSSLSSVSSNPHLVTDLDDELSNESGSLGGSKRGDSISVDVDGGENHPENGIFVEIKQDDTPDLPDEEDKKEEDPGNEAESRLPVPKEQSSSENALDDQATNQSIDETKTKDIDNISVNNVDVIISTSGSSSSSDTQVEDHPFNIDNTHYNPDISTVSALSDQSSSEVVGCPTDDIDKNNENQTSVEETVAQQHASDEDAMMEEKPKDVVDIPNDLDSGKNKTQNLGDNEQTTDEQFVTVGDNSFVDPTNVASDHDNDGNENKYYIDGKMNYIEDSETSFDANRDSGAQDLHNESITDPVNTSNIQGSTFDHTIKKKITFDVDADDTNSSSPSATASDTDSDREDVSSPDSCTDAKGSYSFQMSQPHNDNHEQQRTSTIEHNKNDSLQDAIKTLTMDNDDVTNGAPGELGAKENSRVRIISKLELSDASSDSSDVLEDDEDEPPSFVGSKRSKGSEHRATNNSVKKISFDLRDLHDNEESDISGLSDTSSDDDVNNNNESNPVGVRENSDDVKDSSLENSGRITIKHHDEEAGGESLDVYSEFSDDAIDSLLTGDGNDNDVKNAGNLVDSNSNVTTQRTIGVDPDVKFSFDLKTQVKVRDDEDDDDIDV